MKLTFKPKKFVTWIYLLLLLFLILISDPCGENKHLYLIPGLWLAMIVGFAWSNQILVSIEKPSIMKIIGLAIWDFVKTMLISLVILVPVAVLLPAYACYTDRARVSEAILSFSQIRNEISSYYNEHKTLEGLSIDSDFSHLEHLDYSSVSSKGEIFLAGIDPVFMVLMTPKEHDGELSWECAGAPIEDMPSVCKNKLPVVKK